MGHGGHSVLKHRHSKHRSVETQRSAQCIAGDSLSRPLLYSMITWIFAPVSRTDCLIAPLFSSRNLPSRGRCQTDSSMLSSVGHWTGLKTQAISQKLPWKSSCGRDSCLCDYQYVPIGSHCMKLSVQLQRESPVAPLISECCSMASMSLARSTWPKVIWSPSSQVLYATTGPSVVESEEHIGDGCGVTTHPCPVTVPSPLREFAMSPSIYVSLLV